MAKILKDPKAPASSPAQGVTGASPTRGWRQRYRKQIFAFVLAVVALVIVAVVGMALTRGNGDNVSTSPASPAEPATTSSDIRLEDSVPRDVGGEGAAPASSADKPAAPQQAATSESAPPVTAKGFSSGRHKLSQITTSSSNVVVALFGTAREGRNPREALQYIDVDALAVKKTRRLYPFGSFYPFTRLEELVRSSDDKSFLVIGSLRDPTNNKFLDPKDALPDVGYLVSTLFADDFGDESLYEVQQMVFLLYKTSSGEWRIRDFSFREFLGGNTWDRDALTRQLKKANNEPFNIYE